MNFTKVKQSLKLHEGKRNLPYQDSLGVWTVGYGHNMEVPLSDRAIEQILEDDLHSAVSELDRAFPSWKQHSENRQDVLVEMIFNLGAPRLSSFKNMWKALDDKDYPQASAEMLDSKWASQVGQRAETLAMAMLDG